MVDATTNQFQDLMWLKKYNLVSLSQLNTVNNTDTAIDLNLNIYHLIRSALQHGSNMWQIFSNQQRPIQWRQGNLKNESDTRCKSNNQKWFDHRFNDSIQMSQWPVHIKQILLLTKIIKDVLSYSKGVQKKVRKRWNWKWGTYHFLSMKKKWKKMVMKDWKSSRVYFWFLKAMGF